MSSALQILYYYFVIFLSIMLTVIFFSQAKKFDFVLVSVHLKAAGLGNSDIARLEVN